MGAIQNYEKYKKTHDEFGNNINFPDKIVSPMTIKGLLGKWTYMIFSEMRCDLCEYYFGKKRNLNAELEDVKLVMEYFTNTVSKIHILEPILEDLTCEEIYGMEDIFIAVFGVVSDEVYVYREFFRIYKHRNESMNYAHDDVWDTNYMWNEDCDDRLWIILNNGKNVKRMNDYYN